MKPLFFIINPVSGNGKALKVWRQVEQHLKEHRINYQARLTESQGHAQRIAQELANASEQVAAVVAVGGDGTIHEVVNGVATRDDLPVGFLPGGTGNDFSRGFAIPNTAELALANLLQDGDGAPRRYDLGVYQLGAGQSDGYFINAIGIGFDGEVAKVTNESWYKPLFGRLKLGTLAYLCTVVRLLFTYQTHEITVHVDGQEQTFSDVWLMAIANIPYYGGGMKIAPHAVPDDGKFNICIVHGLSRWKLLTVLGTVFNGTHIRFPEVTLLEGSKIEVSSSRPMTVHADGEIIGSTPITMGLQPGARPIL